MSEERKPLDASDIKLIGQCVDAAQARVMPAIAPPTARAFAAFAVEELIRKMHPMFEEMIAASKRSQGKAFQAGQKMGWCCPYHENGGAVFTRCGPVNLVPGAKGNN